MSRREDEAWKIIGAFVIVCAPDHVADLGLVLISVKNASGFLCDIANRLPWVSS
jgi:hypothetical protein